MELFGKVVLRERDVFATRRRSVVAAKMGERLRRSDSPAMLSHAGGAENVVSVVLYRAEPKLAQAILHSRATEDQYWRSGVEGLYPVPSTSLLGPSGASRTASGTGAYANQGSGVPQALGSTGTSSTTTTAIGSCRKKGSKTGQVKRLMLPTFPLRLPKKKATTRKETTSCKRIDDLISIVLARARSEGHKVEGEALLVPGMLPQMGRSGGQSRVVHKSTGISIIDKHAPSAILDETARRSWRPDCVIVDFATICHQASPRVKYGPGHS